MSKMDSIGVVVRRHYDEERHVNCTPSVRMIPVGGNVSSGSFNLVIVSTTLDPNEYDWLMQEIGPRLVAGGKIIFAEQREGETRVSIERELA